MLTKVKGSIWDTDNTYTPSATGAVERTLQSKLDEVISVKDFGVVGDGIVDDSAAITLAEASEFDYIDLNNLNVFTTLSSRPVKKYFNGTLKYGSSVSFYLDTNAPVDRYELSYRGTKSPIMDWENKNVAWYGTSIPHEAATSGTGYPSLFGQSLNCSVENWAWAGSHAYYDVDGDEFTLSTVRALSMTEDDRLAGLALYGATSVYDDSFDPITLASQMTADYRIKAPFANTVFDAVVLDHNHNDRNQAIGTLTPATYTVSGITTGATTTITLSDATGISIGDAITLEQTGIDQMTYFAARVQGVAGNALTFSVDSSSFTGSFVSGTLTVVDRNTLYGAFDFVIAYIKYAASYVGYQNMPTIILCSAPSAYTGDTFANSIYSNMRALAEYAEAKNLPYFNVLEALEVDEISHITYFPDATHPTTLESRKAITNVWAAWASGGKPRTFSDVDFLPSGAESSFTDGRNALYTKWSGGFATPSYFVGDDVLVLSDDFSVFPGTWTTVGTAPTQVIAPWDAGANAILCTPPDAGTSYIQKTIATDDALSVAFDLWLDDVVGLTSTSTVKTVTLARIDSTGAYLIINLTVRPTRCDIQFQYFKTPFTDLVTIGTAVSFTLSSATQHRIRIDSLRQGAVGSNKGVIIGTVDGQVIATDYDVLDSGQTTPITIKLGGITNNTGQAQNIYIGNLDINKNAVVDYSSRFTGSFTAQSGENVTVVNGIIVSAV